MVTEIIMPKLSNSMREGQLVKFYKTVGDSLEKGEPMMEIMTDKVNMEVEAPATGVIRGLNIGEGDSAPIGTVIGIIADKDEKLSEKYQSILAGNIVSSKQAEKPHKPESKAEATPANNSLNDGAANKKTKITPRARKLAEQHGLKLTDIFTEADAITEKDILAFLEKNEQTKGISASPIAIKIAQAEGIALEEIKGTGINGKIMRDDVEASRTNVSGDEGEFEVVPFTGSRKIIADRLSQSKFTAPHLYISVQVDMNKAMAFRNTINKKIEQAEVKISYTDIIVAAVTRALIKYKMVNAGIFGSEIRKFNYTNIGVAVDTGKGLIVPVIRNTHCMNLLEIGRVSSDLFTRARTGKINPDELKGGTFTISNLGILDVDFFTAIINPPESAILAVSSIKEKAVVLEGQIVARPMMQLVLSIDHRVIDGALATRFLDEVKEHLETPELFAL